ncbi:MAG TPA: hypothetical protein VE225_02960 [Rubrobacteraceae bacterium]|nr:hypothetical protein [Rubrobacteraceae bacterium]
MQVSLLIPSHALPLFSYLVPERLIEEVRVGTAVVAPLSGYSRLGIVIGFDEPGDDHIFQEIRDVAGRFSLPEGLVKLSSWAAGSAALSLHAVLRMALPPGLDVSSYEVRRPAPHWRWRVGSCVSRTQLRRSLGGEGLKAAEERGMVELSPTLPQRRTVELARAEEISPDLRRAPKQRALLEALAGHDDGRPVADLLRETGAGRDALRRLVRRGAVRLEKRAEPVCVSYARGSGAGLVPYDREVGLSVGRGGACWLWQMPHDDSAVAAAAVARAAAGRGRQTLVLAPKVRDVERLVEAFGRLLPAGLAVAPYHSGLQVGARVAVYEAARREEVDVLVGTRGVALVPLASLGAVCVIDEPNEAHRAPAGYEGVPIHVRDLARARGHIEGAAAFFFSPTPSLRLYAPESGALRLRPRKPSVWPVVSVIDTRGTGASLSSALLDACRQTVRFGGRAGVVVNRLRQATSITCKRCGFLWTCPGCSSPLALHSVPGASLLSCRSCRREEGIAGGCVECGSDWLDGAGLAVGGVRTELERSLGGEVGLLTADVREGEGTPVVVGTARAMLHERWDLVALPDADSLLSKSGSKEKGFRLLYRLAEGSGRLVAQTRMPGDPVLLSAVRGDYESFAAAELQRRRALGYPPYAHLAEVSFEGSGEVVRRAVESRLRPALGDGVEILDPVPLGKPSRSAGEGRSLWRALLRSRKRDAVAEAATLVARLAAEDRGLKTYIKMDPEEV